MFTVSEQNPEVQNPELMSQEYPSDRAVFDVLIDFMNLDGWVYREIEHRRVLALGVEGKNGRFDCYTVVREAERQIAVYSICPVKVPDYKRYNMAAFITMLNYGTVVGNFELNLHDGEVRYKTSLDAEDAALTPAFIKHLIYTSITTMDDYLPGILSVIYGNISPEEAFQRTQY